MMRAVKTAVLAVLLLAGCGGGAGSDTEVWFFREYDTWVKVADPVPAGVTPPSTQIQGSYVLTGFVIDYFDPDLDYQFTLTQADYASWQGSMEIDPADITQTLILEGDPYLMMGSYTLTWEGSTAGTFHVTDTFGSYDVEFSISGNTLTTDSGYVPFEVEIGAVSAGELSPGAGPGPLGALAGRRGGL